MESLREDIGLSPLRRLLTTVHLWLGLSVGVLFVLTALSGSVLVFYQEIDTLLNPPLRGAADGARPANYEALYQSLLTRWPESQGYWSIEIPEAGGTITSRFFRTLASGGPPERRIVSADPESLAVVRDVVWGGYAMTWLYDFHQQLLLSQAVGRTVMGIVGLIVLAFMATGVAIWWPRRGNLAPSLGFSQRASLKRRMLEIHQITGIYGFAFLVVLVMTGTMIALPNQAQPLIARVSPLAPLPVVRSAPQPGAPRISFDRAAAIALAQYPEARIVWMDAPSGPTGAYQIRMRQPDEPSPRFPRTYVWIDQYNGDVLSARTARDESAGDKVLTWLHPLHNGEAFGLWGRLIVFVLGFLPLILFVTGLTRWLKKRP